MSEVQEYAARLSKVIGPRPAGTEEEQQAAFFLDEVFHDEADLEVETEEFHCNPNYELPRIICCIISVVLGALAMFLSLMLIPATIVCALAAVFYALEVLGVSPLTGTAKRGLSQNIVAKYTPPAPNTPGGRQPRSRKVILLAHYDSGRVRSEMKGGLFKILHILQWVVLGTMILTPVALLLRLISGATAGTLIFFNVLVGIGVVGSLIPIILYIMHQTAPYNDGANCNAAGVAVLAEVARRVGNGIYGEDDVVMHGRTAALDSGAAPENAELVYAEGEEGADGENPDQSAAAKKAQNEALGMTTELFAEDLIDAEAAAAEAEKQAEAAVEAAGAANAAAAAAVVDAEQAAGAVAQAQAIAQVGAAGYSPDAPTLTFGQPKQDNVPDWYRRARENASKQATDSIPVQRSRFADALDAAEQASRPPEPVQQTPSDVELRLQQVRESIMGVAPSAPVSAEASATGANTNANAAGAEAGAAVASAQIASDIPESHAPAGVGGYLSNTLSSSDYESSLTAPEAEGAQSSQGASSATGVAETAQPANSAAEVQSAQGEDAPKKHKRRTISLPSLTDSMDSLDNAGAADAETAAGASPDKTDQSGKRQSAPLADQAERESAAGTPKSRKSSLAASLPSISMEGDSGASQADSAPSAVSQVGSFAVTNMTGAFDPVGDELVAHMAPEDIYVDDADDSAYDDHFTESGALAGPGYVDMPESRASRMLGRFRGKKKKRGAEEMSFAESIGVSEDFDARQVGKERGGWESFRNDNDAWAEEDEWNGGAFSRVRDAATRRGRNNDEGRGGRQGRRGGNRQLVEMDDYYDETQDMQDMPVDMDYEDDYIEEAPYEEENEGGRPVRDRSRDRNPFGDIPLSGRTYGEDREAVQEFYNGPIDMEVWFVGLGAELADNAGIKAFLSTHSSELRGSMVIDLDGLGAGDLSMIEEEGRIRPVKMASRMKRYVRKAQDALGMHVGSAKLLWGDTAAYYTARHGLQTLHLAGIQGGKPAYFGEADDTLDNLDMVKLEENTDFVMELIRGI